MHQDAHADARYGKTAFAAGHHPLAAQDLRVDEDVKRAIGVSCQVRDDDPLLDGGLGTGQADAVLFVHEGRHAWDGSKHNGRGGDCG